MPIPKYFIALSITPLIILFHLLNTFKLKTSVKSTVSDLCPADWVNEDFSKMLNL